MHTTFLRWKTHFQIYFLLSSFAFVYYKLLPGVAVKIFRAYNEYELFVQVSYSRMTRRFYYDDYGWVVVVVSWKRHTKTMHENIPFHRLFAPQKYTI